MAKPSNLPEFDTNETRVTETTTTIKDDGFVYNNEYPAEYDRPSGNILNYLFNLIYKWIKQINDVGILEYDNGTDYIISSIVNGSDGIIYQARSANGPSSSVVDPVGDATGTWVRNGATVTEYASSGTWTKPNGLKYIIVEGVGGGGGGGGTSVTGGAEVASSRAGSGGGYSKKVIPAADLLASETVTIGALGSGGSSASAGSNGGTTSFGSHITCNGGIGGKAGTAIGGNNMEAAKVGGTATGGDINVTGGLASETGISSAFVVSYSNGGNSYFGSGGKTNTGATADGYGSGGGGRVVSNSQAATAGLDGTAGVIYITEVIGI